VQSDPPFRVPIRAEGMMPVAARTILKHAVEKPLWEWEELFATEDDFFEKYRKFNAEAAAYSKRATELDEVLGLKVRLRDFSAVWPVFDHFAREMASYYLAKLLELDQNRFILLSQPFEVHIGSLERRA
jgi:hypothetical protein